MSIFINKNPYGRMYNFLFGLCAILDGLSMVLSMGFLKTTFCLDLTRNNARNYFNKLRSMK